MTDNADRMICRLDPDTRTAFLRQVIASVNAHGEREVSVDWSPQRTEELRYTRSGTLVGVAWTSSGTTDMLILREPDGTLLAISTAHLIRIFYGADNIIVGPPRTRTHAVAVTQERLTGGSR